MIIIKPMGGLGNQMFQYAMGRALALKHNVPLLIDISLFNDYELHEYGLCKLNICAAEGNISKARALVFEPNKNPNGFFQLREPHSQFYPEALNAPSNLIVTGYWQTEKYFLHIRERLLNEFTINVPISDETMKIFKEMQGNESVSLHVRRGDYFSDPAARSVHGVDLDEYYQAAINHIVKQKENAHFYIFSDDPDWVTSNMKLRHPMTYVLHNDSSRNHEDLWLMSACKHNIIANSTFSWWGAWLNQNPEKMVVAPQKWLLTDKYNMNDIIPDSWVKL